MRKYPDRGRLNAIKIREKNQVAIFGAYCGQNFGGNIGDSKCKFSWFLGILRVAILGAANFFFFFLSLWGVLLLCYSPPSVPLKGKN